MESEIKATLVANAGILIEYNNKRLLVDGIHCDKRHYFSPVSKQVMEEFLKGQGPFSNIDFLLFTHNHVDHFSPRHTMEYLEHNMVRTVFLPKKGDGKFTELKNYMQSHEIGMRLLDMPLKKRYTYLVEEDIGVTAFHTVHMGEQFQDIENYCYILTVGGKNLLFVSDGDYKEEYFDQCLKNIQIDAVFINPLWLNHPKGRRVVCDIIKPQCIIIYHIPFLEHDKLGFRKMVKRDIERFRRQMPPICVIWDELQEITLFDS